jgi:asparagine synthase (glutamine-hydrolysing)
MHDAHVKTLEKILNKVISKAFKDEEKVCVSYSGGLDCSVIASIASKYKPVYLCTVGTKGAQDLEASKVGSKILESPLDTIIIKESDIVTALPDIIDILKTRNPLEISIELALYMVCKNLGLKLILTGQGADELFGGYSRYLRMEALERNKRMKEDVAYYLQYNHKQEQKLAETFNKKLVVPYMNHSVIEYVEPLSMDLKIQKTERKYLLKLLARKLDLPTEIVDRPKKAVQYGSGILAVLKSLSKKEGLELHEYLRRL